MPFLVNRNGKATSPSRREGDIPWGWRHEQVGSQDVVECGDEIGLGYDDPSEEPESNAVPVDGSSRATLPSQSGALFLEDECVHMMRCEVLPRRGGKRRVDSVDMVLSTLSGEKRAGGNNMLPGKKETKASGNRS